MDALLVAPLRGLGGTLRQERDHGVGGEERRP